MAGFGQFAATSQFYLYGRSHCTSTGYETAMKKILKKGPDLLASPDLSMAGKVAIVTGANSGVGKEVAMFLAKKGAVVYMVCRSQERGEAARREIQEAAGGNLYGCAAKGCEENGTKKCSGCFSVSPPRMGDIE